MMDDPLNLVCCHVATKVVIIGLVGSHGKGVVVPPDVLVEVLGLSGCLVMILVLTGDLS